MASVPPASTIMMAMSPPSIMRPATTSSNVDSVLSSNVGCAIHSLPWRDRRTAPIGPSNGMPDTISAADAPLIDSDVVRVHEVGAHDRGDDLHLVAEAFGEATGAAGGR